MTPNEEARVPFAIATPGFACCNNNVFSTTIFLVATV
jgi:hypothetical protein